MAAISDVDPDIVGDLPGLADVALDGDRESRYPAPVRPIEPEFTFNRGAARIEWEAPMSVVVELDYLRAESRSGELKGQITIRSKAPGSTGLLHRANLNLTSTVGRTSIVKQLNARAKDQGLDWDALIEHACYLTIDAHRAGKPAVLLRDVVRPPAAGWLLPPLVLGRLPTILFGDGGSLKSYLALAAAISIHSGYELLSIKPTARLRVAYLDWEFDAWEHRERMRRLVGSELPDLLYMECAGPLRDQVDRIQREIRKHDIGFLVIDSVALACSGPPEEAESALTFFDALRSLEVGALLVAHVNRSGDTDRPFGSTFWHNSARATWYAKKQEAGGSVTVGLFNRKASTDRTAAPIGFTFSFDESQTAIERTDVRDSPELAAAAPLKYRIVRELGQGALSLGELAERLGEPKDSIQKACKRDEGKLLARIPGLDGVIRYGLTAPERES